MITWVKDNNRYLGFDDGTLVYRVFNEGTGFGWEWENIPEWSGMDGYDTAEQAMDAAEADHAEYEAEYEDLDLEMSEAERLEILGDLLYEEAKEAGLFQ